MAAFQAEGRGFETRRPLGRKARKMGGLSIASAEGAANTGNGSEFADLVVARSHSEVPARAGLVSHGRSRHPSRRFLVAAALGRDAISA